MPTNEIKSLISLIDDPDEDIFNQIKEKIISIGKDAIPFLENAWEHENFGLDFQKRVENIVHTIQLNALYDNLIEWSSSGANSLLEGMILVNQYQYPELNKEAIYDFFDKIEKEIWLELHEELTALEKIKIINHFLFETRNFRGDTKNFHSPYNSYINEVLDTQKGNPISLACIYIIICQRLKIPVYGINLPRHFVVCYMNEYSVSKKTPLFYINPFSKGIVFGKAEITDFLIQLKLEDKPEYYNPCDNKQIIKRILNNLIYSYELQGYNEKVLDLKKLYDGIR